MIRYVGNLLPMPGVFPDYPAPVVRNAGAERELILMRWGMPPATANRRAAGHNIRNTSFILVSGFGSGAYSAKLLNGTRQRFSGFSQPRQWGEERPREIHQGPSLRRAPDNHNWLRND